MSGIGGPDRHDPFPFEALRDKLDITELKC